MIIIIMIMIKVPVSVPDVALTGLLSHQAIDGFLFSVLAVLVTLVVTF